MSFSSYFTHKSGGDRIFAVEAPKIKFGRDSLLEIGDDAKVLGMTRVAVFTDQRVGQMEHVAKVVESLKSQGLDAVVTIRWQLNQQMSRSSREQNSPKTVSLMVLYQ